MKRGERSANRTQKAIKQALLDLIREKNYPDIKVNEITVQANVGRSTFYKHFQSKAHVLVDIHKDMFNRIFRVFDSPDAWFSSKHVSEWGLFLKNYQRMGRNPFLLSYKLGSDLDFLVTNITKTLSEIVESRLRKSFTIQDQSISIPVLAESVSAVFNGLVMSWFTKFQSIDAVTFAGYIQQSIRAQICQLKDE